jgi:hypothetical protein
VSDDRPRSQSTGKPRRAGLRRTPRAETVDLGQVAPRRRGTGTDSRSVRGFIPFGIFLILSVIVGSYLTVKLHNRSNIQAAAPYHPARYAVVFVVSGVTASDLHAANLPHLHALMSTGVTYDNAWAGEYPTSAATLAASVGTGDLPKTHGLLGDKWEDAKTHLVVKPTTPVQTLTGSIDQLMEPLNVSTLAGAVSAERPKGKVLAVGGSDCSQTSAVATWAADYVVCAGRRAGKWGPVSVAGHALPAGISTGLARVKVAGGKGLAPGIEGWALGHEDNWVGNVAVSAMRQTRAKLVFVTFPEPELLGPYLPANQRSSVMSTLLRGIDTSIGRVMTAIRHMNRYADTVFAVVSTHGFDAMYAKVAPNRFRHAVIGTGTQATYLWADGMAALGLADVSQAQAAAQVIESERMKSIDADYYKLQRHSGWAYSAQYIRPDVPLAVAQAQTYLLDTDAAAGSAQVVTVFSSHVGARGGRRGGFQRTATAVGLDWGNQRGFMLISGHGTYRGVRSAYPARLVDLAPTLAAILGTRLTGADGTVLADSTFRPPSGTVAAQATSATRFAKYRSALKAWETHG